MPPTVPAGLPTIGIVWAKLIVNGEDYGIRPFLVPINDGKTMCAGVRSTYVCTFFMKKEEEEKNSPTTPFQTSPRARRDQPSQPRRNHLHKRLPTPRGDLRLPRKISLAQGRVDPVRLAGRMRHNGYRLPYPPHDEMLRHHRSHVQRPSSRRQSR